MPSIRYLQHSVDYITLPRDLKWQRLHRGSSERLNFGSTSRLAAKRMPPHQSLCQESGLAPFLFLLIEIIHSSCLTAAIPIGALIVGVFAIIWTAAGSRVLGRRWMFVLTVLAVFLTGAIAHLASHHPPAYAVQFHPRPVHHRRRF
jgi:hypothetical protein